MDMMDAQENIRAVRVTSVELKGGKTNKRRQGQIIFSVWEGHKAWLLVWLRRKRHLGVYHLLSGTQIWRTHSGRQGIRFNMGVIASIAP